MATQYVSTSAQLHNALSHARGGDAIVLRGGNYGAVDISGRAFASDITIKAESPLGAAFNDLNLKGSSHIRVEGVRVQNCAHVDGGSHHVTFANSDFESGFYTKDASHIVLSNNDIGGGYNTLILNDVSYFKVANNTIHDARSDLLRVTGNSHHGQIENNTLRDVRPVSGDHPDAIQFLATNGNTPHDITIRGNYIYDNPATGALYGQGIFIKDSSGGYRNFLIEDNLIAVGSPNSIYVQDGADNVVIRNNSLLSWKPDGGGAQIRLVGDNSGTSVYGNAMLKLNDESGDASIGKNLVYSNNPSSPLYWGKLFEGNGSSWEGFIPKDGSVLDTGSFGAYHRIAELLGTNPQEKPPIEPSSPAEGTSSDPASELTVKYYLVDADTDKKLAELVDNARVDVAKFNADNLTIVAEPVLGGASIESIKMNLDSGSAIRIEDVKPYALFGDSSGDYGGGLKEGLHNVKFDFYDGDGARGTHLGTDALAFTIVNGAAQSDSGSSQGYSGVSAGQPSLKYYLVDADADKKLVELVDNARVDVAKFNADNLTIVAEPVLGGASIESIKMNLDSGSAIRIEDVKPYALFGDSSGDYRGGLKDGLHNVKFAFYDGDGGRGTHLGTDALAFTIVNGAALSDMSL